MKSEVQTPTKVKIENSTPVKVKIEKTTPPTMKTPKVSPVKVMAVKTPKTTPAKVQTPKTTPVKVEGVKTTPAKVKAEKTPKNTPATQPNQNQNKPTPGGKKTPNTANKRFQSPNKRFPQQSPHQNRSFNRNPNQNGPFNMNQQQNRPYQQQNRPYQQQNRPFNRAQQNRPFNNRNPGSYNNNWNQQQNGPNYRNQPFNNRNQPFNNSNQPFNNRNPQFNRQNSFQAPFNNRGGPPRRFQSQNPSNKSKFMSPKQQQGVKRKATTSAPTNEKKIKYDTPEKKERTVFVGNVPLTTTENEIKQLFKKYGPIESIRFRGIPRADLRQSKKVALFKKNFNTNRTSMNSYVVFVDKESASKAFEVNGQIFKEHCLRVNLLLNKRVDGDKQSIFVGNLPFNAEDDDLIKVFKDCGEIHSVRISRDSATGVGRGFGYVNFKSTDGVELALQMENVKIKDRTLRIKRSDTKKTQDNSSSWTSIKIDNLLQETSRGFLINWFKKCGKIINITFNNNPLNRKFKNAIIAFEKASSADYAANMKFILNNKKMYVTKDSFNPHKHVFIRDVPLTTKVVQIKNTLKDCGIIKRCKLLLKPHPPYTTGFGIVEFETVEGAEKALELKSIKIRDDVINIESYIKDKRNAESDDDDDDDDNDENEEQQNGEKNDSDAEDDDSEEMEQDGDEMEQDDDDDDDDDEDDEDSDNDAEQDESDDDSEQQEQGDDDSEQDDDDDNDDDEDGDDDDDDDDE